MTTSISAPAYHAIHLSFGRAEISNKTIDGEISFYKDDFFTALRRHYGKNLTGLKRDQYSKLKYEYLNKHFNVKADGSFLKLLLTGNNEDESLIKFEFRFETNAQINKIIIKHNSLISEFSDQMNLLNILTFNGECSLVFNKKNTTIFIN